jgi:hypothetical protein
MAFITPIFMKITGSIFELRGDRLYLLLSKSVKKYENYVMSSLTLLTKHDCHCAGFHETRAFSENFCKELLYQISLKSDETFSCRYEVTGGRTWFPHKGFLFYFIRAF